MENSLSKKEIEAFPDMLLALQGVYYAAKNQRHNLAESPLSWNVIMTVKEALIKAGHKPPTPPKLHLKTKL